ncbi:MAG: 4Fe-4S dicluster domain-containing protein, partial [Myxococcales bacterium]|nr:4Fe-4S dicluster domain-containing protein [Myxococcales bacterium]
YLADAPDPSAALATHVVPALHPLERWGDARAADGTVSLVQPVIRPLVPGVSAETVLSTLAGDTRTDRARLAARWGHLDQALATGVLPDTRATFEARAVDPGAVEAALRQVEGPAPEGLHLSVRPDRRLGLGEGAHNPWLQELPEPVTQVVWDNAALIGRATAAEAGVATGDVVRLTRGARSIELPALIVPDQAEGQLTVWLGFGRAGVGVDAGPLRSLDAPWLTGPVELASVGRRHDLVTTQRHHRLGDEPPVLHRTLDAWRREPDFARHHAEPPPSILPDRLDGETPQREGQWGMTIDLDKCIGCNACVVACQAENDIPTVGKAMVALGREMHWLRVDHYRVDEGPEAGRTLVQPMACQHCEKAPCEYVCPVGATTHSPDGLNEMTYNRCVGTRFCSNNCPYKVRRFNFFDYRRGQPQTLRLQANPDVTARARGVMEKCTYCVQRIRRAQIEARAEGRPLGPAPVQTACQQTCPADAIAFGRVDLADSRVSRERRSPRAYAVLNALGTRPRTMYLARITHPDPERES